MIGDRTILQRFVLGLREAEGSLHVTTLQPGEGTPLVHGLATPERIEELRCAIATYFGIK